MRVVVLTHVFPRAAADPLGAFLLHLAQPFTTGEMGTNAQIYVVAPHAAGLLTNEVIENIPVTRFHYASDARETLAYTGVMHEQVARGLGGKFLFARFILAYLRAARNAVRQHHADVIHAHWWLPGGFVAAIVSKLTRVPLVITTHGTDVEQLRRARWTKSLAQFAFGQACIITCGSGYLRDQLLALDVADEQRVHVIPMPVNPIFVERKSRIAERKSSVANRVSQSANEESPFTILTVARLTQQKSIDTLIDALGILRTRGLAACLRIAGDGDQRAALEAQTRALRLEPFVEFLGGQPQNELPALYADCDVFVLPSVREGMGLVLAEALLCGAPVIATNSGGVTDIVRDGETGLLFPECDSHALAATLEKFARNPVYAAQLAQNGRALVCERFTPEHVAAQFFAIYTRARH